jgi:hypothetical protein
MKKTNKYLNYKTVYHSISNYTSNYLPYQKNSREEKYLFSREYPMKKINRSTTSLKYSTHIKVFNHTSNYLSYQKKNQERKKRFSREYPIKKINR